MDVFMSIARRVNFYKPAIIGIVTVIIILSGLLVIPSLNNNQIDQKRQATQVLFEMVNDLNDLEIALQDMRVSARGYIISQNVLFSVQYEQASERQRMTFASLRQLASEDRYAPTHESIIALESLVDDWRINRLNVQMDLVTRGNLQAAEQAFSQGDSQRSYEDIRRQISTIREQTVAQRHRLNVEIAEQRERYQYIYGVLVVLALVVMLITGYTFVEQARLLNALSQAEQASTQLTAELSHQVNALHRHNQQLETLQNITMRVLQIPHDTNRISMLAQIVRHEMQIPGFVIWSPTDPKSRAIVALSDDVRYTLPEDVLSTSLVDVLAGWTGSDQVLRWGDYHVTVKSFVSLESTMLCGWIYSSDDRLDQWMVQHVLLMVLNVHLFNMVQREQQRLSVMFSAIPDGVMLVNHQGHVLLVNPRAEHMLPGIVPGADIVVQMNQYEYFAMGGKILTSNEYPFELARQQNTSQAIEIVHQLNEERFPVRHRVIPINGTLTDVTAQGFVIVLEDLRDQYELDRMRSDFISMVSHELRTPLAAIIGATSMLTNAGEVDLHRQQGLLRLIESQGLRLQVLVEDVLNISRIDHEGVRLQRQQIDIQLLVRRFIGQHQEWSERVKLRITTTLPEVFVDVSRVEQILTNLLDNARKYAPNSEIWIDLEQISAEFIQVTVRDFGVVLTPQAYERVFQRFYQLPQHGHAGGVGLGLAICRYFVEAHGGTIGMRASEANDGTVVQFTLPIVANQVQEVGRPAHTIRIMVLEDDPSVQEIIQYMLSDQEYEVAVAGTVQEAYHLLERWYFDALVVDVVLPDQSGLDFVREVRTWLNIPIMMVTARSLEEDVIAGLRAGVDDYMIKPFSYDEFGLRIQALLRRGSQTEQVPQSLQIGSVEVAFAHRQVLIGNQVLDFTPIEYRLFVLLVTHVGQVLPHERMLYRVWGDRYDQEKQYLWVHISHVRSKLREVGATHITIENVRGVGYRMQVATENPE